MSKTATILFALCTLFCSACSWVDDDQSDCPTGCWLKLSYTYNIAKRKYREYPELTTPQYATRHNAAWVVKYSLPRLHSIVSVTDRFSSGRPYHNPMLPGLMNDEVKPYNSLDLGVTFLASKKVIIHASTSNILCRKNEFGKVDNKAVLASSDHFFYVGVYVTLGKKAAYDVSNF